MNLYLLTQDEFAGYDTFDSMIVAANNTQEAKHLHPLEKTTCYKEPKMTDEAYRSYLWIGMYGYWASSPENVKVDKIGITNKYPKAKVILASYNAS